MKSQHNQLVKNFRQFTNCKSDTAEKFLAETNWDFNNAINLFFERGYVQPVDIPAQLFARYKSVDPNTGQQAISPEGLLRFFEDINVDPSDPLCGYLLYLMQAEDSTEITLGEFSRLINTVNSNQINVIRKQIFKLRNQFQKFEVFKEVYSYLFELYQQNPKFIKFQNALALWKSYLKGRFTLYDEFISFIQKYNKNISKDAWKMILQFEVDTKGNINNYKQTDGWPLIIDNFVEYVKNK